MNTLLRKPVAQRHTDVVQDGAAAAVPAADFRQAPDTPQGLRELAARIKRWGHELGFDAIGISDIDLSDAEPGLLAWLEAGYHGEMDYMEKHGVKRARPAELVPGTLRVISVRLPYLPAALLMPDAPLAQVAADTSIAAASSTSSPHVHAAPHDKSYDWRRAEQRRLRDPAAAVVSVYARGRDYHKVLRQRLQRLAERITAEIGPFGYRAFTDSAPVMEVELARRAGVGWRGKHTLLLSRDAGSFFFIGELYVDVPLPPDFDIGTEASDAEDDDIPVAVDWSEEDREVAARIGRYEGEEHAIDQSEVLASARPAAALPPADGMHCGQCRRCIDACPTGAIVAPYRLDARRCISYLTIEYKGSIPLPLRTAIGNRIYGCDDCQTACPWNKFAKVTPAGDFDTRNGLDSASLIELFAWTEAEFDRRLEGSAIRRIGHAQWLRNIAVALGNALRKLDGSPAASPAISDPMDGSTALTSAMASINASAADNAALRLAMIAALRQRASDPSAVVREHIEWALAGAVDDANDSIE